MIPSLTEWDNDNAIHRVVFVNIPAPLQGGLLHGHPGAHRVGRLPVRRPDEELGAGAGRRRRGARPPKQRQRRFADYRAGVYMRTLLRDPAAGLMHSMIYFGFLVLLGVTTVLEIDHQLPEDLKFLHGGTYQGYSFVADAAGLVFLGGVVWAILRRYVQRPYRIRIKTKPEHAVILGTFLAIGLSGFGAEMFRIALEGAADGHELREVELRRLPAEHNSSTGGRCRRSRRGTSGGGSATSWRSSRSSRSCPLTMLRHMFTSPLNMYLQRPRRPPEGRDEADAQPGRDRAGDVRRLGRRGLHVEAAARHGRVHDVRPLHERVPGARHRQAARPARDRAQDG